MATSAVVDQARSWANGLLMMESRGPGDVEAAMRRIERRWGVPARTLWSLRYRPPKDVYASVMIALMKAHEDMCQRQKANFEHELAISEAKGGVPSALARLALTLAGQQSQPEKGA